MPAVLLLHFQSSLFCGLPDPLDLFLRQYKLLVQLHARLVAVPAKDTGSGSGQVSQMPLVANL